MQRAHRRYRAVWPTSMVIMGTSVRLDDDTTASQWRRDAGFFLSRCGGAYIIALMLFWNDDQEHRDMPTTVPRITQHIDHSFIHSSVEVGVAHRNLQWSTSVHEISCCTIYHVTTLLACSAPFVVIFLRCIHSLMSCAGQLDERVAVLGLHHTRS